MCACSPGRASLSRKTKVVSHKGEWHQWIHVEYCKIVAVRVELPLKTKSILLHVGSAEKDQSQNETGMKS